MMTIDVPLTSALLPLLAAASIHYGPGSVVAWVFEVLMLAFTVLNICALGATFYHRKTISLRPPPPRGGLQNVIFNILVWSALIASLWLMGWAVSAVIAGVSLFSLLLSVSIARGRSRTA